MMFGKKILLKIASVLAVAVPAFAADVAPLYFDGVDDNKQQVFWDDLMKYKMFGAEGINFAGQQILVPDKSGWFGTAAGDFNMRSGNNKHTIGGPILVGGNLIMSDGNDSITSGPVRVLGDIKIYAEANWRNSANLILGAQCVQGEANREYVNAYKARNNDADVYVGDTYENCPASVPQINTDLRIPKLGPNSAVVYPAINTNNNRDQIKNAAYPAGHPTIDVPKGAGTYDIIIDYIQFANENLLEIRMPYGGRLTRIFLTNGFQGGIPSHNQILVSYMDKDAVFDEEKLQWVSGTATQVKNQDYAGNLLFYTTKDISWAAMQKGDVIQGTFITTGTITVRQSMTLAGQLLANNINVDAFFDGSGFRYVPFDPPILDIDPEVFATLVFKENDAFVPVPVSLSIPTKVNVYFDYCFEFLTNEYPYVADANDIGLDPNGEVPFPVCANGESAQVVVYANEQSPDINKPKESIHINVKIDEVQEPDEKIRLHVMNLTGAVLEGNLREGFFDLTLQDTDLRPITANDTIHTVEDVPYTFKYNELQRKSEKFKYVSLNPQSGVTIASLPAKGYLLLKGDTIKAAGTLVSMESLEKEELQYVNAKDEFSGNNVYTTFTFTVMDDKGNVSKDGVISVFVDAVNDAPEIAAGQVLSVKENSVGKTVVGTIEATDADTSDVLTYAFDSSDENYARVTKLYELDSKTGKVTVKDGAVLNYESADSLITIKVKVSDNSSTTTTAKPLTATGEITLKIEDVNEKHEVENSVWTIKENETYESYPKGFGTIKVTDEDSTSATKGWRTYSYQIVENSDDDPNNDVPFYLNAKTGVIKIGNSDDVKIDFETISEYKFHVAVTDSAKEFTTTAEITVKVEDVNEKPEFGKVEKSYFTFENTPNGIEVGRVEILDPDAADAGNWKVSFKDDNKTEGVTSAEDLFGAVVGKDLSTDKWYVFFAVADSSKLDFEALADTSFDVTFTITDKGGESISASTKILVRDVNEEPSIADASFTIEENAAAETKVGTVIASDPDTKNPAFGTLTYTIDENEDGKPATNVPFTIDNNGNVYVAADDALDFETKNEYVIHVTVTDGGTEPKTAVVTITLKDVNEAPTLEDDGKDWTVAEHVKTGTVIGNLVGKDVDAADASGLTYSMTEVTEGAADLFTIDPKTGVVSVKDSVKLDYEKLATDKFEVIVTVTDKTGETASVNKVITVTDVNEAPTVAGATFDVDENSVAGTKVGTVIASDPDTKNPAFGTLTYTIDENADASSTNNVPFVIDDNGNVSVAKGADLDYETTPTYTFHVTVTDGKFPKTVEVTVNLNDLNEPPTLEDDGNDWIIAEHSKKGELIGTVTGSDVDGGDQAGLTYSMAEVTPGASALFEINQKGEVVVKDSAKLDFEALWNSTIYNAEKNALEYSVQITVTDKDDVPVSITKTITVTDVNEKPTVADATFKVDENAKTGTEVGSIVASDPDTKTPAYGTLYYSIDENLDNDKTNDVPFAIDAEGKITVADGSALDFELKSSYTIHVTVTDRKNSETATVVISINDINEKPAFADKNPSMKVDENTLKGTLVGQVTASDDDCKDNSCTALTYELVAASGAAADIEKFVIDSKTGKITVKADSTLNFEEKASYKVNVIVYDGVKGAAGTLTDTAYVSISINDVNDAPVIADKTMNVPENSAVGTTVGQIEASDEDTWSKLTYQLVDVNAGDGVADMFAISAKGVVTVAKTGVLDFEKKNEYQVYVVVTDNGADKGFKNLSDTALVTIKVTDVPEKPSIVDDGINPYNVNENSATGTVVAELVVKDQDAGEVTSLKPTLIDNDNTGADTLFNIALKKDGSDYKIVVTVKDGSKLDYEKINPSYDVTFKVTDDDGLDASIKKTINIIDVNESPIVADQSFDVPENTGVGISVGKISAKDPDTKNPDFSKLTYTLVDKDVPFVVNSTTGEITVKSETLNFEDKSSYTFSVAVSDGKNTETIKATVNLVDVNEDPTIAGETDTIPRAATNGDVVATITGSDVDAKDNTLGLHYELVAGDTAFFAIDENTGKVTVKGETPFLNKDQGSYSVTVKVTDNDWADEGTERKGATATVKIVLDNHKPVIITDVISIPEDQSKKDTVKASDADGDNLKYSMTDPSNKLKIDPVTGEISVKPGIKVDHESADSVMKVTVSVTDGLDVTAKEVTVKITDVNEAPVIKDQTFTISEDSKVGSVVGKVESSDPDVDPKYTKVTYTIVEGDTSVFKIDPTTGTVTLKDSLDYETKTEYPLVISVSDGEFSDTATVTVKVKNVDEKSEVIITKAENRDTTWTYPDTIYTNLPDLTITYKQDGEILSIDTTLTEGKNVIVITYKDPSKDVAGSDTVVVLYSEATPIVTVTTGADDNDAANIYTIVENTDAADTNIYVNDKKNDIKVTVIDPATKDTNSFTVKVNLDTVSVPQTTYTKVNEVAKKGIVLNENPTAGVSRTPVNGTDVSISYKDVIGSDTVTVTYLTDKNGEVLKTPVKLAGGKMDTMEVITVSYVTKIGGKDVTVSYQADAVTGEVLKVDSNGNLMTGSAAEELASSSNGSNGSGSGSNGSGNSGSNGGSSNTGSNGSNSGSSNGGSNSGSGSNTSGSNGSGSGSNGSNGSFANTGVSAGMFTVTYDYVDATGNTVTVSYAVDEKGEIVMNSEGNIGYSVAYTYTNKYGNAATQSVFIVLDQVGPKVEIVYPTRLQVIHANFVEVTWTVNGVTQDTLTVQGLEKGYNSIVRFYQDKAGNVSSDTVVVIMKDGKDVEIAVEQPVTEITKEKVEEYYGSNPPKEGQTFAVSIKNPTTEKEVETLIGGDFKPTAGSGEEPYPGLPGHLGPTLVTDIRLPVINSVGGLATLDDLVGKDGYIALEGVDAQQSTKVTVDEYVKDYCNDSFKPGADISRSNLYKSKMDVKIWIYTTTGNFVDYYSFTQEMNDPDYTNDAGMLQMYFEMKPDKNGDVRTENGRLLATGAYLYKVEAKVRSELQCSLPPVADPSGKKKGDVVKTSDELLKSFGYKRPNKK